jgi:hypothetical protein
MILLQLRGDKVIGVYDVNSSYTPKDNEVMIDSLEPIEVGTNEIGYMYYRNGSIEYEIKKRG